MRPMLASPAPKKIKFPVYASVKIDGIRAFVNNGILFSRTYKPIPNKLVKHELGRNLFESLDGELTVGPAFDKNVMQNTTSGVMSREGAPDYTFWVFDYMTTLPIPYEERLGLLQKAFTNGILAQYKRLQLLPQKLIHTDEELQEFERNALGMGYEGIMLRDPNAFYKFGRSTAKEGYLLKVKRFSDSEAIVIGVKELMRNDNQATINELGYTERSSHKENKTGMDTLGALCVQDLHTGIHFDIGTGFTSSKRQELWNMWLSGKLEGKTVKYKYFEIGVKEAPRFPVFIGFRDPRDL